MKLRLSGIFTIAGALALAGCQSYPATPAESVTGAVAAAENAQRPKRQRTVQEFMDMNPALSLVDGKVVSADRRVFIFESAPQIVTTTLPAYTPAPGYYNNSSFAAAAYNLNSAVGTVPAVSRSTVMVCRVTVHGKATGKGSTPSDWTVEAMSMRGNCA
ncbi:hypothetical protein B5M44_20710 [Shinella sumterensis]|uniref:hypothetical protein n=1 Tax=Shinella sumterensis TaxID=1967501 RepID=UPI00106EF675|nr:hypothetical protein [Shinella sumterensis]MCD1265526.1 hypothetical protein [Shinella sumterensis]TFE95791.1 hypothetical protein B5M44_20710 [Shinella sumterensis]